MFLSFEKSLYFNALPHFNQKNSLVLSLLITGLSLVSFVFRIPRVYLLAVCLSPKLSLLVVYRQSGSEVVNIRSLKQLQVLCKEFRLPHYSSSLLDKSPHTENFQRPSSIVTAIVLREPKRPCQIFRDLHGNRFNKKISLITELLNFSGGKVGETCFA